MITEGVISTLDQAGNLQLSAMGPVLDEPNRRIELRPFPPSRTLSNLIDTGCGIFHLVDDANLLARSVIGMIEPIPATFDARTVTGQVLQDCCRWIEFKVDHIDQTGTRATVIGSIAGTGNQRDFRGFNRAANALIEAAILVSRKDFLPREMICQEFEKFATIIEKTGSPFDAETFQLLRQQIESSVD